MGEAQGLWEPQRRHLTQTGGQRGLPAGETSERSLEGAGVSHIEREREGRARENHSGQKEQHTERPRSEQRSRMLTVNWKFSSTGTGGRIMSGRG